MKTIRMLGAAAVAVLFTLTLTLTPVRAVAAAAPDEVHTRNGGNLTIQPIHHAAVMLTWNGKHILIDPAPLGRSNDPAADFKALPTPDIILITHIHGDHFSVPVLQAVAGPNTVLVTPQNVHDAMPADLQAKDHVMRNGEQADIDSIPIQAVAMYNTTPERSKYHPKGAGNGYILTLGGERIYLAGDTEETPELEHLRNIDVAFIPMNLPFTQTVQAAAKWVRDFRPKIVYPYHYRDMSGQLADVKLFKKLVGGASDVRLRDWY